NSQRGIEQQRWLLPLRSKLELGFTRSPLALLPGAGHNGQTLALRARKNPRSLELSRVSEQRL
ncbi:hypothetical protein ACQUKE_09895, partial [Ralstonia pseudosolanacearum]